ncbi:MAG: 4-hydroxy-tetrahydrodipicolinate reductase [Alphaproteobacteria bacterium]|jgi:4-hydroxy-tetrahydrodipicolinate reductase|nr:4-hydroxy-tetrahydrodipicolinate reductase [Alphaproteobacteria bacterium]
MGRTKIGIVGCAGRMGLTLARQVAANDGCELCGGTEVAGSEQIGRDLGELAGLGSNGIVVGDDPAALFAEADAVLDFTVPAASADHAALAAESKTTHVVGTTGFETLHQTAINAAAVHTVVVQAANMSLGVNLLLALTRQVAAALDPEFDIEIVERHHRHKVDAPSGTALALGRAAADGRGVEHDDVAARGRDGITGERKPGDIGYAVLRGGNVVGEHSVVFAAADERVALSHIATDRAIFARGAVTAALWAQGKPPGLYGMADVLGLAD